MALDELDIDAYAVPGQKWLLGPEGMGALWVRRAFAEEPSPETPASLIRGVETIAILDAAAAAQL